MFPYRRILFPVDYSAAGEAIVPFLREMTLRLNGELLIARACPPEVFYAAEFGWQAPASVAAQEEALAAETRRLEEWAAANFTVLRPRREVHIGHPVSVIESLVKNEGIDLIMMPTHGHGLFRRLLLGSVTARLIHDLSCSVWTGCHLEEPTAQRHLPCKRILCALEPGRDCEHVTRAAAGLAEAFGAELRLVSAVEWPGGDAESDPGKYWQRLRSDAEETLAAQAAVLGKPVPTQVVLGPIVETLRKAAEEYEADLLVIGRGDSQSRISGLLSNLYSIVREAPCPVLSV